MTYKSAMTMDKAWTHAETPAIPFAGLFAKMKGAVKIQAPTGYQDENGFHFGEQPEGTDLEWPANW
jgi:hypothetical protein